MAMGFAELLLLLALGGAPAGTQMLYSNPVALLGANVVVRALPAGVVWALAGGAAPPPVPMAVPAPPPPVRAQPVVP